MSQWWMTSFTLLTPYLNGTNIEMKVFCFGAVFFCRQSNKAKWTQNSVCLLTILRKGRYKILSAKSRHLFERVSYLQTLGMVPVSSISRLSLLNSGAMSTPKLLNTTLETSLPLSVAVYLSCEALGQISVRLRKRILYVTWRNISYIEDVNLIQSICQVSVKMM